MQCNQIQRLKALYVREAVDCRGSNMPYYLLNNISFYYKNLSMAAASWKDVNKELELC